jgi:ATP-dependent Clp endopeptidase proteolytic subunit ClpP
MTKIMLYGDVGDSWCDPPLDAASIVAQISGSSDTIEVRINSGGGNVVEGLAIFNALQRAKDAGRKVDIYIDGLAASMASVIACAGSEIYMAENALIMIHNPWDGCWGDAADLRQHADRLDLLRAQMVDIYVKRTGATAEAITAMMDAETWFDAETALAQGFITGIVVATYTVGSIDVSKFGFRKAPVHPLVAAAAAASNQPPAAAGIPTGEKTMADPATPAAPANPAPNATMAAAAAAPPAATPSVVDVNAAVESALAAETARTSGIRALCTKHNIETSVAEAMLGDRKVSLADANAKVLDILAARGDGLGIGHSPAVVTQDFRDKWQQGALNNILMRAGQSSLIAAAAKKRGETIDLDPGEFRGMTMVQMATEALQNAGQRLQSRDPAAIIGQAFTARASGGIFQGTGDFTVLLENALRKTLQAAYATTPDTWSRFCGTGSVTDFRAHRRYLLGSFSTLDSLNEQGEFKNKPIPDGARESITATTKGNIIGISRQAIAGDDLGAFSTLAVAFGRAARLSVEVDVYALLAANPLMSDGFALFASQHNNIGTAAAPTVTSFDQARQLMASQRDVSNNEVLDIRPAYWLGPMGVGGAARVVNGSQYDPNTAGQLQRVNIALGMFEDIIDTPRLTGTTWYAFADKTMAPAIEVAFLNGVTEPFLDNTESWRFDGTEWKVRLDYGVAAVNWRSAVRNAGA